MGLVVTIASGTVTPMGQSLVMRSGWLVGEGAVDGGTMRGEMQGLGTREQGSPSGISDTCLSRSS